MWENNCAVCHDADGKGGFFKAVSDNACLKCHDASVHSEKQVQFISAVAEGDAGAGAGDAHKAHGGMRSSDCVHCHVEHRGEAVLKGVADTHCTQCHRDLPQHTQGGAAAPASDRDFPARVTGFDTSSHPRFGRGLIAPNPDGTEARPRDPTVLNFNHKVHMARPEINNDCTICHSTTRSDPRAVPVASQNPKDAKPPWSLPEDAAGTWGKVADGRYMQPVSYDRHCRGCHPLQTPDSPPHYPNGIDLPHGDIALVRGAVMSLKSDQLDWLSPRPREGGGWSVGGSFDTSGLPDDDAGGSCRRRCRPLRPRPRAPLRPLPLKGTRRAARGCARRRARSGPRGSVRTVLLAPRLPRPPGSDSTPPAPSTPSAPSTTGEPAKPAGPAVETANDRAMKSLKTMVKSMPRSPRKDMMLNYIDETAAQMKTAAAAVRPANPDAMDSRPLWFYASYVVEQQCVLCHKMKDDKPEKAPAAAENAMPPLRSTVATGIPTTRAGGTRTAGSTTPATGT